IARLIHYKSPRAGKPFVYLNCAAIPEGLVEAELFGIERGVATGVQQRVGQFQAADGGTLFLDEIADLSLTAQAKILRVLQEHVVERVGGRSPLKVDVRVLAASNKDLEAAIRNGSFREDLYYRLKVIRIHMPALREIRDDIPLLANRFLAQCCREANKELLEFGPAVIDRLRNAPWPGNVRQLQNEIKRLVACARRRVITLDDLSETPPRLDAEPKENGPRTSLKSAIERLERQMIAEVLRETGNNQQKTARSLGLSRQGLINKINRYGLR
ncbi:MAG: sigma-54 dependent transcriptional regulator, partial [Bryobacteraceae bacterium]